MDEVKEKILQLAAERMYSVGIRSVSVDDIARELGISKKTFYVYFATKDELIEALLQKRAEKTHHNISRAIEGKNVIEVLMDALSLVKGTQKNTQPQVVLYDLHKYYPEVLKRYQKQLYAMIVDVLQQFLIRGQKEGVFREELDGMIVAHLFADLHQHLSEMIESGIQSKEQIFRVSQQGIDILMHGIITDKGKELIGARCTMHNAQ